MCTICGCGGGETRIEGDAPGTHRHADGSVHRHADGQAHHGQGQGHAAPGMAPTRLVQVERDILAANDAVARRNRAELERRGVFALNLVSSPGSGKTTLLVRTIERLAGRLPIAVVEGDQQTSLDADRIRATGAPALQVNTGRGCHLDALMIEAAIARLDPAPASVLMIENVGNLVCPAGFDLGEAHKVAILSVTEGDDKPLKYPDIFAASDLVLINKTDLLPYVDFDMDVATANARRVKPGIKVLPVSARSGEGLDTWIAWLMGARAMTLAGHPLGVAAE
ncbi:MAG: hydrogenase nickel incorporation protein HypB [Burkholderiales bacterium]|nr:hydrogenase nickel incorporation protein HypB [Burkholderiales bacterium]